MHAMRFALLGSALALTAGAVSPATAAVTQPPQPKSGPGGSSHAHKAFRVTQGGSGNDGFYVFEPVRPRPASAPLAIVTHGYYEFSGYGSLSAFIRHSVLRGDVVIYPRWQTGVASPCPGPFDITPCVASEVSGIRGAIAYLRAGKRRVRPQLNRTSYFGFSFGGIVTANMLNQWRWLGVPQPRAVFLDDPHDGGLTGPDEPALAPSLGGLPPSTLFECHSGADGVLAGTTRDGASTRDGSCNAVFGRLTSIPAHNKDLVLTHTDGHGSPALSSGHGVCSASAKRPADAYDWNFCWKVWDALQSCAYERRYCRYALGDTPAHRNLGVWSDGVLVRPLKIQDAAPIRP